MLDKKEILRYSKQLLLPEIGMKGQEKLKQTRVLVVGAGGLGCPVLQYLAAAGTGTIGMVDFDLIDETNLQRQVLYSTDDVGKSKAIIAGEKISSLNPFIKIDVFNKKLDATNAVEIISDYDWVVDCTDNFESRYLINDACVLLGKTVIYAGIHKFEAQVSVFNLLLPDGKRGPTYRCAFPEMHSGEVIENCSLTGVIGTLPGIAGMLQANEVIKLITGIGETCSGKILLFNALTLKVTEIKITRDENSWIDFPMSIDELKNKTYIQRKEGIGT
ncbi:MAG: HesA/MoeB/ThiF family protein [Bacteroidetes bacterium]|nr:HesA/MoeB/ThiF family protein [Bacteroidota bacterium]